MKIVLDETKFIMALFTAAFEHGEKAKEEIENDAIIRESLERIKGLTSTLPIEQQQLIFYEITRLTKRLINTCFSTAHKVIVDAITKTMEVYE